MIFSIDAISLLDIHGLILAFMEASPIQIDNTDLFINKPCWSVDRNGRKRDDKQL